MPPIHHRNVLVTAACAVIIAASLSLFVCILTGITLLDQQDEKGKSESRAPSTAAAAQSAVSEGPTPTLDASPFYLASPTLAPTFTPLVLNNPPLILPVPTHSGDLALHPASGYQIVVAKHKGDSLFVLNQTPDAALPLASLQLGDGASAIRGAEWGLAALDPGTCVTAWKDSGNPKPPDLSCTPVGAGLMRNDRFWKEAFNVYYNGSLLGECLGERCLFVVPG